MTSMRRRGWLFAIALSLCMCRGTTATARTIELTDADSDRMAVIGPEAPRSGWLMHESHLGEFTSANLDLCASRALLIRFSLDRIPSGQRITRADWIINVAALPRGKHPTRAKHARHDEQQLFIRRIIGDWGHGACYLYRSTLPRPVPWTVPGAAGPSTDRAAEPTGVAKFEAAGEQTINVTEDVELWYTGAVKNEGWIVNMAGTAAYLRLNSPLPTGGKMSRLRITFEPE